MRAIALSMLATLFFAGPVAAQGHCPNGAQHCGSPGPPTGPSCGQSLSCTFSSMPPVPPFFTGGHFVTVNLVDGSMVTSNNPISVSYTLKYTGGCEANGGTLDIRPNSSSSVRLEDKPWYAPCTNLVPLTFEATLGGQCGCKLQIPAPAFGPDSCRVGFVWREACGTNDRVCVPPQTRTDTANENASASSRVASGGYCKQGFVWREACGPDDHVCVPPESRARAKDDNAAAPDRVAHFDGQ